MKKPKRRFIRVIYRYRIISKPVHQKSVPNKKGMSATEDQTKAQNTAPSAKTTSEQSSTLATFDYRCNPYQQFIDNLSLSLSNLPLEVFTGSTPQTDPDGQEKGSEPNITVEEKTIHTEKQSVTAEEKTTSKEKQSVTAEESARAERTETANDSNSTINATSDTNDIAPAVQDTVTASISHEAPTTTSQTSPNLRYLTGIPSCFLASRPTDQNHYEKETERKQ
ncbi:hypothetical protein C0J08_20105 [Marinomonas sp. CT5]|uniref:hypothetical protein n=1 Tax=Marinomonas sp. CT5 TaxID=2066133 RepID=UPI001BAEC001|nr:hypothetical protein [Marinomonas sp. CT5]QUX97563.1 hypothetical protein C0J08_20105 [Marinomonas sp. CT5]